MKRHIKILTDGSCDLPKEVIERVNPGIIGINVCFGEESYIGGIEIDEKTFYENSQEKTIKNPGDALILFAYGDINNEVWSNYYAVCRQLQKKWNNSFSVQ